MRTFFDFAGLVQFRVKPWRTVLVFNGYSRNMSVDIPKKFSFKSSPCNVRLCAIQQGIPVYPTQIIIECLPVSPFKVITFAFRAFNMFNFRFYFKSDRVMMDRDWTVAELRDAVASGDSTARDLCEQFLERIEKPDVDEMHGIAPAIAIRQKNSTRNPRSTVATATEVRYDGDVRFEPLAPRDAAEAARWRAAPSWMNSRTSLALPIPGLVRHW